VIAPVGDNDNQISALILRNGASYDPRIKDAHCFQRSIDLQLIFSISKQ